MKQNKKILGLIVGIVIMASGINLFIMLRHDSKVFDVGRLNPTVAPTAVQKKAPDTFSYTGVDGKDALSLLKSYAKVAEKTSGFVQAINSRKADDTKHEFWAFYVNGKMAEVGSAQYVTKNTDKIEWKIDHY